MNTQVSYSVVTHANGSSMKLPVFNSIDINRPMAIVDLEVIKRLAEGLNSVPLSKIKHKLIESITNNAHSLTMLVQLLEDEVAFHRSINLITEYKADNLLPAPPVEVSIS